MGIYTLFCKCGEVVEGDMVKEKKCRKCFEKEKLQNKKGGGKK
jgi:hypothetical protein